MIDKNKDQSQQLTLLWKLKSSSVSHIITETQESCGIACMTLKQMKVSGIVSNVGIMGRE